MKTRIITFAALILFTTAVASAENYRTFSMPDLLGKTIQVFIKVEMDQNDFEFDSKQIFKEIQREGQSKMIDVRPFIKPEKEVDEEIPGI